jgi:hypothetical protein
LGAFYSQWLWLELSLKGRMTLTPVVESCGEPKDRPGVVRNRVGKGVAAVIAQKLFEFATNLTSMPDDVTPLVTLARLAERVGLV